NEPYRGLGAGGGGGKCGRPLVRPQAPRARRRRPADLEPGPGDLARTARRRTGGGLSIDGQLVLPADVQIVPVPDLPEDVRARFDASDEDFTITRQRLRAPSSVVDKDSAALLEHFRAPARIVDAVLSFAAKRGLDPQATLEQAYPVLNRLCRGTVPVPAGSDASRQIEGLLERGDTVDRFRLIRRIQVLEHSDVFLARDEVGRHAAVKFYRAPDPDAIATLERE